MKFTKPSLTKQCFRDETNINTILSRYDQTGQLPNTNRTQPQYGDFTKVTDYATALTQIEFAKAQFFNLPSEIRKEFNNNPAVFLEYASDPDNLDHLRELGLANPLPPETPKDLKTETTDSQEEKPAKT